MEIDENSVNSSTYLANCILFDNKIENVKKLLESENAKYAVDCSFVPLGKLKTKKS
jgi:hypothetical protein